MIRRLSVLCCAALLALLPACGGETNAQAQPDASLPDADVPHADSGPDLSWDAAVVDEDAGVPADAGTSEPDAGETTDAGDLETDAGAQQADAGQTADAGDPHADADPLEYCGSGPTLAPGNTLAVTLNGQAIDFAGGYSWGSFEPGSASFYAEASFTWTSTSGEYYLTLYVTEGFAGTCPLTISLPDDYVTLNLYGESAATGESIDLFSSDVGASGALKLDAYDLAGGACSVSAECQSCRLAWGSDVAVIDGRVVESCL